MKKLASIVLVLLLVHGMTVEAQMKKKEPLKKEKASERQRSLGGQRENGEGTGVPVVKEPQKDSVTNEQQEQTASSPVIQSNKDQNLPGDGVEKESTNEQAGEETKKSNAPAIIQTTSSESGSPAILSKDNGKGRDGTNNVQRSSYNMAGAEVPGNLNLSDKNQGKRNVNVSKTRAKKQEGQPVAIGKSTAKTAPADETVKQTKKNKGDQDKKSSRKSRRKRDRDSR